MILVEIGFWWLIAMIIYYTYRWIKEKKRIKGVKEYFKSPLTMSIGERMRKKRHLRW